MYLLDTNVISELRRREKANRNVAVWAAANPVASLFLSAVSIFEIERGALLIARKDPERGNELRTWIDHHILPRFEGRILSMDAAVARRCAALHVPNSRPERDAFIAATAMVHGFTVVTRNVADFKPMGVAVINPWEA